MSLYAQAVRYAIANTEAIVQKAHNLMAHANQASGDDPETTAYYVSLELKDNHFETIARVTTAHTGDYGDLDKLLNK